MSDIPDTNTYIDTMATDDEQRFVPLQRNARVLFCAGDGTPEYKAGRIEVHWSDELQGLVITSSGVGELSILPRVSNSVLIRELARP